jgi:hypothetical protein
MSEISRYYYTLPGPPEDFVRLMNRWLIPNLENLLGEVRETPEGSGHLSIEVKPRRWNRRHKKWAWHLQYSPPESSAIHIAAIELSRRPEPYDTLVSFHDGHQPAWEGDRFTMALPPRDAPPIGALFESIRDVIIEQAKLIPLSVQTHVEPGDKAPGKQGKREQRTRGPSADVLDACHEAMKLWLDNAKPLSTASDLAGVNRKTVQKWIPNVLEMQNEDVQTRWVTVLRSLDQEKHLGRFRED